MNSFGCIWLNSDFSRVLVINQPFTYAFRFIVYNPNLKLFIENKSKTTNLLRQCTRKELRYLLNKTWKELWDMCWSRYPSIPPKKTQMDTLFNHFISINTQTIIDLLTDPNLQEEPPFMFPKGRYKKSDKTAIKCAIRETFEETGIDPSSRYVIYGDCCDMCRGFDNIHYFNYYFIGYLPELDRFDGECSLKNSLDPEINLVAILNVNCPEIPKIVKYLIYKIYSKHHHLNET